jgi:alpha-mannosidase
MQYGSIKRVTIPKNRFNAYRPKHEYANQQWSSVFGTVGNSENNPYKYEITLINRNKYGIFAQGSKMMLSLLKSAKFTSWTNAATLDNDNPRPETIDLGFNRMMVGITFRKVPNASEFNWRAGYEFNFPLVSFQSNQLNENIFSSCSQLIKILNSPKNISIGAIKICELPPAGENHNQDWFLKQDDHEPWIIIRLAEYYGVSTQITLQIHTSYKVKNICETDMLERKISAISPATQELINLNTEMNHLTFLIKPYEIKTIAIQMIPLKK